MELILPVLGVLTALAGALMVGFGIPNNAFGTGNTLIEAGTTAIVGGFLLIGLALVVRQLRGVIEAIEVRSPASELGPIPASPEPLSARLRLRAQSAMPPAPPPPSPPEPVDREPASAYGPRAGIAGQSPSSTVARKVAASERVESPVALAGRPAPHPPDDEEAGYPEDEPMRPHTEEERIAFERFAPSLPHDSPRKPEHPQEFDALWPAEPASTPSATDWRGRAITARGSPGSSASDADEPFADETEPAVAHRPTSDPGVSILKSGVIDGMAYTLYVDGSIEAELPQGTLRFGTIDELRDYLAGRE